MTCPRLTIELATLKRISSHWTVDDIERRIVDHQRHCAGCNGSIRVALDTLPPADPHALRVAEAILGGAR